MTMSVMQSDRSIFNKNWSSIRIAGVLEEETSYVSLCINKILSLYKGKIDKVVLIGHSMVEIFFYRIQQSPLVKQRSATWDPHYRRFHGIEAKTQIILPRMRQKHTLITP